MASAGSLEPLGRYGVVGLPTVTLLSAESALASVGTARAAVTASNATARHAPSADRPARFAVKDRLVVADTPRQAHNEGRQDGNHGEALESLRLALVIYQRIGAPAAPRVSKPSRTTS